MNTTDNQHSISAAAWLRGESTAAPASKLGIIGLPLSGEGGTRYDLAPDAVRSALEGFHTFDVQHNNDLRTIAIADGGNLAIEGTEEVTERLRQLLGSGVPLVVLGGDGRTTRTAIHGLPGNLRNCGLVSLDSHFDLGEGEDGGVGRLLQDGMLGTNIYHIGIQDYANTVFDAAAAREAGISFVSTEAVYEDGVERVMRDAFEHLRDVEAVYFNLDMSVLDRSFAPAAPNSRPGGLLPWQLRRIAYLCGSHFNTRVMDIVGFDPEKDFAGVTAMAAAACLLAFASGTIERREHK